MKIRFAFLLAAAAMLASCGGNTPASSADSSAPASSPDASIPAISNYLNWVDDNKVVIDLFGFENARFTYGNAALASASNTLDLNDASKIGCSTTFTAEDEINFVYVTYKAEGTSFSSAVALYAGVEGDKLSEFFDLKNDLEGAKRGYVAISKGKTVQWTKNKNAAMDRAIEERVSQ